MKTVFSSHGRPVLTAMLSVAAAALLAGCQPALSAGDRRQLALEHDVVPPLSQGPLIVEYLEGGTAKVVYTLGAAERTDWIYSSGEAHTVYDRRRGVSFHWSTFGPNAGKLDFDRGRPDPAPPLRRWWSRQTAQRLGNCGFAGEPGRWYRFERPPNWKVAKESFVQACITADGVLLAEAVYGTVLNPRDIYTRVVRVSRAPVSPDVFSAPANLPRAR